MLRIPVAVSGCISETLKYISISFIITTLLVSCSKDNVNSLPLAVEAPNAAVKTPSDPGSAQLLVAGLQGASGSAIGPGGDLFVTESFVGRISRINVKTGKITTFATGLPPSPFGGVYDLAFIGGTAYALVTLVGPEFGTEEGDLAGIYRIDGPDSFTVIADLGAFSRANPPSTDYFVDIGVQFAIQVYRGGFLVTDGHHNRVLHVTVNGEITEFKVFDNTVPTGLAVRGATVFMAEAGPLPHLPEDGRVVSFCADLPTVTEVASGAPLLVDVEFNRGRTLFALAQGFWDGVEAGEPAEPNTGSLVRVNDDGTFSVITDQLDRPTSLEFIKNTAYIITLAGEVWTVENVTGPPFGV